MKPGKIIYISHGGGPLPLLGDPGHEAMVAFMKGLPDRLPSPGEILVVSAHWEEMVPTLYDTERQELLYDYYGFPPETYDLRYPTIGNPGLVESIRELLTANGFEPRVDRERGLDHGVFIPLMLMYPDAGIPVTQISLMAGLDPSRHLDMGAALRPLLERDILIIGSGFSFHNIRRFSVDGSVVADEANDAFQDWLIGVCTETDDPERRAAALRRWADAPNARYCHPREEHLLPLHICAGIAEGKAEVLFDDLIVGKRSVAFGW